MRKNDLGTTNRNISESNITDEKLSSSIDTDIQIISSSNAINLQDNKEEPYILECEFSPEERIYIEENTGNEGMQIEFSAREDFVDYLRESSDPDHKVIYSLLATDLTNSDKVENLNTITNAYPDNKLASLHLLQACSNSSDSNICNEDMVNHAISLNSNNSLLWSMVASYRMAEDDYDGALQALEELDKSAIYDDHSPSILESIYNASKQMVQEDIGKQSSLLFSPMTLSTRALQFTANTQTPALLDAYKLCTSMDEERTLNICLEFGKRIENEAIFLITQSMGKGIQNTVNSKLGINSSSDDGAPNEINSSISSKANNLLTFDGRLAERWILHMSRNGEMSAFEFVKEEAIRLSSNPDYDPCSNFLEKYF